MTMQIEVTRKGNRIKVVTRKQDENGNPISKNTKRYDDVRIARAILDNTIHANPRIGKVRIKWEV